MKIKLHVLFMLLGLSGDSLANETVENVIAMPTPSEDAINKKYAPLTDKETTFVSANDLLDVIISFIGMTPDKAKWSEKSLHDNPPRFYRMQKINALFDAFELNNQGTLDLEGFLQGDFVSNDNARYKQLLDDMAVAYKASSRSQTWLDKFNRRRDSVDVKDVYVFLIDFIIALDRLGHNKGMIGRDTVATHFSYELTLATLKSIDPATVSDIRKALIKIIDPKQRTFSIQNLVDKHHYPDLSISDVDADFW